MPALKNVRHERFAQETAQGKSAGEAYRLAGYRAVVCGCEWRVDATEAH
jgi:hypothetical protein